MKNRLRLFSFLLAAFIGGSVAGVWLAGGGGAQAWAARDDWPVQEMEELSEVYELIRRNYVEEVDGGALINQAARGMVASLDPHSSYLDLSEYETFVDGLTNEEYGGVGIYIGTKNDWIEIIAPIYNSPASRAGLLAGDLILKINGETTQGMAVDDAVSKMRGLVDTVLKIDVLSPGAPGSEVRHVELVRETIVTPSVLSALVEGYGYLRITRFQNKTLDDLKNALNGIAAENGAPLKGLVLDMRSNPGGYLLSGVGAAAMFLPSGSTVVIEKGRDARRVKSFTASAEHYRNLTHAAQLQETPLVVLVNNGSASASEIVAGALQDHRRAVILGTRTYGKASVQSLLQLRSARGKSALRLTTARYYTPLSRNIQARGIVPDIEVRPAAIAEEEDGFTIREGDIAGHLDGEEDAANAGGDDATRPPFIAEEDYQYDQAMRILRALVAVN